MGPALNTAAAMNAYILADRGTWLAFKNRGDLVILVEGDKRLFNQYGVMLVNPEKHPAVKKELGQQFIDWLVSPPDRRSSPATRSTANSFSIRRRRSQRVSVAARRDGDAIPRREAAAYSIASSRRQLRLRCATILEHAHERADRFRACMGGLPSMSR